MNPRILKPTAIAALILTISASAQTLSFTPKDLVGTWQSQGCEKLEIPGQQSSFLKRTFTFTELVWQLKYTLFADPGCTVALLTSRLSGPYALTEAAPGLPDTRKVTWGQTTKFIAPQAPPILQTMNTAGCGDATLALGAERDLSLTGCLPLGTPSVKEYGQEYDLLRLRNGTLFTGARKNAMNIEANRPTEIFEFPLLKR